MKSSYRLSFDDRVALMEALKPKFRVVFAAGEADVFIARHANEDTIVVSGDSDLAFHTRVKLLARVVKKSHQPTYALIQREQVCKALGVTESKL
jgi:hypothetical protein